MSSPLFERVQCLEKNSLFFPFLIFPPVLLDCRPSHRQFSRPVAGSMAGLSNPLLIRNISPKNLNLVSSIPTPQDSVEIFSNNFEEEQPEIGFLKSMIPFSCFPSVAVFVRFELLIQFFEKDNIKRVLKAFNLMITLLALQKLILNACFLNFL